MYDPECKGDTFMPFHRAIYDKGTGQSPNSPREQVREIEKDVCDCTVAAKMGLFWDKITYFKSAIKLLNSTL